jgi:hypothetical protein
LHPRASDASSKLYSLVTRPFKTNIQPKIANPRSPSPFHIYITSCPRLLTAPTVQKMSPTGWDDTKERRLLLQLLALHPIQVSVAE